MKYTVEGKRVIFVRFTVEANSEMEAIRRAEAGEYEDVDTEPGYDYNPSRWTAELQD